MLQQNNVPALASTAPGPAIEPPFRSAIISRTVAKRVFHDTTCFLLRKSIVISGLISITLVLSQSHVSGAPDPNLFESQNVSPQVDPYLQERYQSIAREQQELYRTRVPITDAMGDDVPDATVPQTATQNGTVTQTPSPAGSATRVRNRIFFAGAFVLIGILAARRFAPGIFKLRYNPWAQTPAATKAFAAKVRAEEEAFAEFLTAFQTGPIAPRADSTPDSGIDLDASTDQKDSQIDPLEQFSQRAADLLTTQHRIIQEVGRAQDDATRQKLLTDLQREIAALKDEAGLPQLLPVWQLASAMEGLLTQITGKLANMVPSTLRTVAGGVDLLNELCTTDLKPDLLTARPLKLLAVDDDLVSRKALSLALKKALNEPDLAENAETALSLVASQTYDVIFLDVQMPGMDGFELCSRIRLTASNRTTPIVFVTSQSDFAARAQSTLSGGHDLMGKPFLTFEVTVKALTLGLRRRLKQEVVTIDINPSTAPTEVPSQLEIQDLASIDQPSAEPFIEVACLSEPHTATGTSGEAGEVACEIPQSRPRLSAPRPEPDAPAESFDSSPEALADLFWSRASTHLAPMRELLDALFQTADEEERQDMLADIYLRIHAFAPKELIAAAAHPVMRLSAALEGLLRKLLENSKHSTMSTLVTLVSGVDLLNELCAMKLTSDLDDPPIQLLVVDDDLFARRAITCALQMTFGRPEAAENGEAALALVAKKQFDVIFLDVQMPGMDGLTVCSEIRKSEINSATPIVFVTAHDDIQARTQMSQSGGNDYMGKPFLNSEISVKALTFALRARLQEFGTPNPVSSDVPVESVT